MDEMSEDDIDEVGWHMEMLTLFFGESEKAYFKTEEIQQVKNITFPIYKKELHHIIGNKKIKEAKKGANELRILSCDIALLGGDANDSSVYTLISAKKIPNTNRYKREVLNIETHQGLHPESQALKIRRLFDDYECDYIVLDRQGNGISVYSYLCRKLWDNERKVEYIPFYSMNEKDDDKLKFYHTEDEYEEKIFTVSATEEYNSEMAMDLKDKIINKRISFLLSKSDVREHFDNESWYHKISAEDQLDLMMPYIQTQLLETEMVLLERVPHDKFVKLKEQNGKRKDRYVSCAMGNFFITKLERDLNKRTNKVTDPSKYFLFGGGNRKSNSRRF